MTAVEPSLNVTTTFLDPRTDFIEQIFAQLEEDNERRAQESLEPADPPQKVYGRVASPAPPAAPTMVSVVRDRRRGSISVSRFGLATDLSTPTAQTPSALPEPANPVFTNAGNIRAFYQAQKYAGSADSFASCDDGQDDVRDEEQVTQIETIAGRVSLAKAMGVLIARRLPPSRTRSRDILATPSRLLIGVSVEEVTTEAVHGEEDSLDAPHTPNGTAFVYATQADGSRSRRSTGSMPKTAAPVESAGPAPGQDQRLSAAGWMAKAKALTKKFRRNSMAVQPQNSSP